MTTSVAIVGGGFSGLFFAYLLEYILGPDADILILESCSRLGGRIQSLELNGSGIMYDSGAAEFYDIKGSPELRNLISKLGLPTMKMEATPYFSFRGDVIRSEGAFSEYFGKRATDSLCSFWELGMSLRPWSSYAHAGTVEDNRHPWLRRTFAEVLDELDDMSVRQFTEVQAHSDIATEPHLTHGLFGFDNLLIDHPEYSAMYTIPGGNEKLIRALASELSARILLSCAVHLIEAEKDHCVLYFRKEGADRRYLADYVVLTPPPLQLRRIAWQPASLREAVDSHISHYNYPTDYLRVTMVFREQFWHETFPEDYFVSDAFQGVTIYDKTPYGTNGSLGILSWLISGTPASRLSCLPDSAIVETALNLLPSGFSSAAQLLSEFRVDRWCDDLGVNRMPGGVPVLPTIDRHRPSSAFPRVLFVGDYLYDTTICGALDAVVKGTGAMISHELGQKDEIADMESYLDDLGLRAPQVKRSGRTAGQVLPFFSTAEEACHR